MRIAVIASGLLKEELMAQGLTDNARVQWLDEIMAVQETDCYIDLLYTATPERTNLLKKLQPATIIINAVAATLHTMPENFIRINGWPGFLKRSVVEAACNNTETKINAERVFAYFNKTMEWAPDIAGFISARVISMIINEAYFALDENVSSKEEIDMAMKLGTNYPYGPFEWGEKIGLEKVYDLLSELAATTPRYQPAALLKKEARHK